MNWDWFYTAENADCGSRGKTTRSPLDNLTRYIPT